jgi:glycopeptide antibiotics resistance protein
MPTHAQHSTSRANTDGWSNRILIAAFAGILFLTLFPFRFVLATKLPSNSSPFLLGHGPKIAGQLDVFLNILLFVPFGFGLSEKLREKRKSWGHTFALALLAGALFSYTIEFLQIYIPSRDSGWEDVFTNSAGAVAGFFLFERWGRQAVRGLSECDLLLTKLLTLPRTTVIILLYFAVWFASSAPLQQRSLPSNWDPGAFLVVGNNSRAEYPWQGQLFRVQFWDRALPDPVGQELTSGTSVAAGRHGLVGDFDFSGPSALQDRQGLLPDLEWTPRSPFSPNVGALVLDGSHWLVSKQPVPAFVQVVEQSNQFAVRVVCILGEVGDGDKRIVSISNSSGITNLTLRQEGANLVFWFRNPLSVKRSLLAWYTPKVFDAITRHDILFSYDGSNLSLFIDGKKDPRAYQLGPGTALAQLLVTVTPGELDGYRYIYCALVFLPAGMLMGFAARNWRASPVATTTFLTMGVCVPPAILEGILVRVSGRAISFTDFLLCFLLSMAGIVWINTDRRFD